MIYPWYHLVPHLRCERSCKISVVNIECSKYVLDDAGYAGPTLPHEVPGTAVDGTDHEHTDYAGIQIIRVPAGQHELDHIRVYKIRNWSVPPGRSRS